MRRGLAAAEGYFADNRSYPGFTVASNVPQVSLSVASNGINQVVLIATHQASSATCLAYVGSAPAYTIDGQLTEGVIGGSTCR